MSLRRSLTLVALFVPFAVAGCAVAVDDGLGTPSGRTDVGGGGDGAREDVGSLDAFDSGGTDTAAGDAPKIDSGATSDAKIDSAPGDGGVDTGGVDSGTPDTGIVDSGVDVGVDSGSGTTVTFPTTTSTTYGMYTSFGVLGAGGSSGTHWPAGDYVEQLYSVPSAITKLDLDITMYDGTSGCAIGRTNSFAVKLNGTVVGNFSWVSTGGGATKTISQKYTFGAVATSSGAITIRVEATTSVCGGGATWNWFPGGTATMR